MEFKYDKVISEGVIDRKKTHPRSDTLQFLRVYSVDKKVNNIHVFYDIYGFKTVKI